MSKFGQFIHITALATVNKNAIGVHAFFNQQQVAGRD